jgi:hypothetical protein
MKKFMTVLLGLSFVLGTASFAFGEDSKDTTKTHKAKKTKAKKTTEEKK